MTEDAKLPPPVMDKSGEIFDMNYYRELTKGDVDTSKKGRKGRQKKTADSAKPDKRSLRATGRVEQVNFKASAVIKRVLETYVGRGRKSLWLEEAILAKLEAEGYDFDA
jgi:hypothetical protein